MTDPRGMASAGVWVDELATPSTPTLRDATDEQRRLLKRARRVIGAALAQRDPDPELVAAAALVCEAGGRRG